LRRGLYNNILLSGGMTNTKNFAHRLKEELQLMSPKLADI